MNYDIDKMAAYGEANGKNYFIHNTQIGCRIPL